MAQFKFLFDDWTRLYCCKHNGKQLCVMRAIFYYHFIQSNSLFSQLHVFHQAVVFCELEYFFT